MIISHLVFQDLLVVPPPPHCLVDLAVQDCRYLEVLKVPSVLPVLENQTLQSGPGPL